MLAVVAGSIAHAKAVILWEKFDADKCVALTYGQPLTETYQLALLVRPTSGTSPANKEWICGELLPRVTGKLETYPPQWNPALDEAPAPAPADGPALEENPLWA
jgi:hypothetical protein